MGVLSFLKKMIRIEGAFVDTTLVLSRTDHLYITNLQSDFGSVKRVIAKISFHLVSCVSFLNRDEHGIFSRNATVLTADI